LRVTDWSGIPRAKTVSRKKIVLRDHVPLPGSELPPLAKKRAIGDVDPDTRVRFTVHLRQTAEFPDVDEWTEVWPHDRKHLSSEEIETEHGALAADLELVREFAREHGLQILAEHPASCMVEMEATAQCCRDAFHVELQRWHDGKNPHRGYRGAICVPPELDGVVIAVTGLENRPTFARVRPEAASSGPSILEALEHLPPGFQSYFPTEIAEFYEFPQGLDGSGETIAILEFGGGYYRSDVEEYFRRQNIPLPEIVDVSIGNGRNDPDSGTDMLNLESALDLQIAGTVAPGAKFVVYFANGQVQTPYLNALNYVLHDRVHRPSVLSISYATAEKLFSGQDLRVADRALAAAAKMGITVCVASGDGGSSTCDYSLVMPPGANVSFPASSPFALACGGTMLETTAERPRKEVVWNSLRQCRDASGGGISEVFPRPKFQDKVPLPPNANYDSAFRGRGVPDVAGSASLTSGYKLMYRGEMIPGGGTSAVAPLMAALIARINQGLGHRCGFLNPVLYELAGSDVFKPITEGFNGAYRAGPGWNACTGLGRPDGTRLYRALKSRSTSRSAPTDTALPGEQIDAEAVAAAVRTAAAAAYSAEQAASLAWNAVNWTGPHRSTWFQKP
jgi:kumamolisin